jgi:LPXTG-motif cell wall-anchored protein
MPSPINCSQCIRYEPPTRTYAYASCASVLPRYETEKNFMRRVVYIAALALMAMVVLAPGAMAQQTNYQHMMPNGQMMDDNMMANPSASASATPSATDNGSTMSGNMMASPSASASVSPSASAYPSASASTSASTSPSATTTASAPRSHHHGGGGSSASAAAGGRLPSTGGVSLVSLVSVGAVALLVGFGLVAARLLRRNY